MADIDKVVKELNLLAVHNVAPNIMHEAIQTIRELQSENRKLMEDNTDPHDSLQESGECNKENNYSFCPKVFGSIMPRCLKLVEGKYCKEKICD